jgi:hypothetical protein
MVHGVSVFGGILGRHHQIEVRQVFAVAESKDLLGPGLESLGLLHVKPIVKDCEA